MQKKLSLLLLLFIALTANTAKAQPNPTVEIVLTQPTVQQGGSVVADVYIRNAVNLGGADVGITVDDKCLTIVDRQPGNLLPATADKGGFSPFSELHDHDTRFAVAVTDRSKIANGDGVFFHIQLKATCATGTAPLKVSFAQLASYKDPAAKDIELISYKLESGSVNAINAQLSIGPAGQVTAIPTPSRAPTMVASATQAPAMTPTAMAAPQQVVVVTQDNTLLTLLLIVMLAIIIVLVIVVIVLVRRRAGG